MGWDTTTFYYPLTLLVADELKAGRLPLWTPPPFARLPDLRGWRDRPALAVPARAAAHPAGEVRPAPPYSAMRALDYVIATLGLYLYARTLGANGLGATIGALAFSRMGSFMVGHLQHDNILRSSIWLPWLLLAAERALCLTGPGRLGWVGVAALALAFEGVGVHVQPVLMSLLVFGLVLLFGPFGRTSIPTIQSPGVSGAAALGQLVYDLKLLLARRRLVGSPLELVRRPIPAGAGRGRAGTRDGSGPASAAGSGPRELRSLRPALVTYDYATSFAVTPPQLLTLVFP